MKKILFLILALFLISCEQIEEKQTVECSSDLDCATGGCSGQICGVKEKVKDIITTCEYLEEYNCLRLSSCGCVDDKCQWEENNDYRECMNNFI